MAAELPKQYRPGEHESRAWDRWVQARCFHADPARVLRGEARPCCILIPPPNVTDRLHLGHALNNTIQDVLARAARMKGFETLWMPGTDHAGIATQAVVEKRLRAAGELKGPLKEGMTREQFVAKAQAFKDEYEAVITGQLKKMGCSCDWDRQRFTMDEVCARGVREAFFRLFKDGLIYRGKRLVNWDPVLQTAVADDECFDEEIDGAFYYLRYPLVHPVKPGEDAQPITWNELARRGYPGAGEHGGEEAAWIIVATTRPETYLGDTGVAVNPHDPRAKALRGLCVELPLVGRVIPIVEDSYVVLPEAMARNEEEKNDPKAKFATGFLKVTPAHDPNDYEIGQRHNLAGVNVMAPDASISDRHGWTDVGDAKMFVGLSREEARKKVVAEFKARGLLEGVKPHRHSVKHSDRSKAVIEPYLSDQWYVRVTDPRMAASANRALVEEQRTSGSGFDSSGTTGGGEESDAGDGSLRFYPSRYAKTYEQWHENIRDWCISRQLWWGHRVPVWHKRVRLTVDNWQDELCKPGLDHIIELKNGPVAWWTDGHKGTAVAFVRDGQTHNLLREPLNPITKETAGEYDIYVCLRDSDAESYFERHGWSRDPDVLDTWFSSALWPLSTMGWPEETDLLAAFNPTSTLCTAREIITLWVSRMVMFNRYFRSGEVPFRNVFIHAVIQDGQGQKMSKSLGNGVDPLDIIESHGADAMRFTLCHMSTQTQDVRMPVDLVCPHTGEVFAATMITNKDGYVVPAPIQTCPKDPSKRMVTGYGVASGEARATPEMPLAKNTSSKFDLGRNFANKLWNAARFALGILEGTPAQDGAEAAGRIRAMSLPDRWMLSRLAAAIDACNSALDNFEISVYAQTVYDLLWRDFCDWYLEAVKPTIAGDAGQRTVLARTLDAILRLLHPVMPFVSETIYEQARLTPAGQVEGLMLLPARTGGLLCTAGWPVAGPSLRDEAAEAQFERLRGLVTAIREVRAKHNVPPKRRIVLHVPEGRLPDVAAHDNLYSTLCQLDRITEEAPGGDCVTFIFEALEYRLSSLADAVDAGAEFDRLSKRIADLDRTIQTIGGRLANPSYSQKAPPKLVQESRDQLARAMAEREAAVAALEKLRPPG